VTVSDAKAGVATANNAIPAIDPRTMFMRSRSPLRAEPRKGLGSIPKGYRAKQL
jgi:hypothetical protein